MLFRLGGRDFAIDLRRIQKVLSSPDLTAVPLADDTHLGLIDDGTDVFPVFDLAGAMGLREVSTDRSFVLVVDVEDETLGITMDRIGRIVDRYVTVDVPETASPIPWVQGHGQIGEVKFAILDADQLFS